jgi:hypothetical protein
MLQQRLQSQRRAVTSNSCHLPRTDRHRVARAALAGLTAGIGLFLAGCESRDGGNSEGAASPPPPGRIFVWDQSTWDSADWR